MELEWDEEKRQRNLRERGLDFADVARFDPESVRSRLDKRRNYGEPRINSIGYLDGRLCTFCWTPRSGRVRVISLRKANARERKEYEEEQTSDP
jgi:uncharacterized DUF497 family protein